MIRGEAEKIGVDMSKVEVIYSLGSPRDVNRTTTSNGTWEQWVYGGEYVYFDGDFVTRYQN